MGDLRLAVDIGGTFTDVVLATPAGLATTKVLTTHDQPADGVMDGIRQVLDATDADVAEIGVVVHGTTLATNALIERRGARTALLTTAGHRDVLEMAFENRFEQYDINIDRPIPLVPRRLRLPVVERIAATGEVLAPLDEDSLAVPFDVIAQEGIESVAIGFLHSYANTAHEERVEAVLAARHPNIAITRSSDVCPEIREYERLSTACANAYVKPLMGRYLTDLETRIASLGIAAPFLLMTSGGGLTSLATAKAFPIRLVESGPAGGAILAADIARNLDLPRVLSFDMGGTTAKICLIDDGRPLHSRAFEVDRSYRFKKGSGLPVRIPVIEMVEIGAGGGSIAHVDRLGRLLVGPESAGSEPGPAAYGRDGMQPTVTDADVTLGRLDADRFAGGSLRLDVEAAKQALDATIAPALSLDSHQSAAAVAEIVDENMAAAARAHAAEWGKDLGGRTLIAYGGAAPLHAVRLMEKLQLDTIVVPVAAGVGSAVGFLIAPVSYDVVRSRYLRLDAFDAAVVAQVFDEMRQEAHGVIGSIGEELTESRRAYMRYVGQGYEIAVDVGANPTAESLAGAFDSAYAALYGRTIPGLAVEILSWTLTLESSYRSVVRRNLALSRSTASEQETAHGQLFDRGELKDSQIVPRLALGVGETVTGPATIVEEQTTLVVPDGFNVTMSAAGDLLVRRVTR